MQNYVIAAVLISDAAHSCEFWNLIPVAGNAFLHQYLHWCHYTKSRWPNIKIVPCISLSTPIKSAWDSTGLQSGSLIISLNSFIVKATCNGPRRPITITSLILLLDKASSECWDISVFCIKKSIEHKLGILEILSQIHRNHHYQSDLRAFFFVKALLQDTKLFHLISIQVFATEIVSKMSYNATKSNLKHFPFKVSVLLSEYDMWYPFFIHFVLVCKLCFLKENVNFIFLNQFGRLWLQLYVFICYFLVFLP